MEATNGMKWHKGHEYPGACRFLQVMEESIVITYIITHLKVSRENIHGLWFKELQELKEATRGKVPHRVHEYSGPCRFLQVMEEAIVISGHNCSL